jgi:hypothetical protein
MVGNSAALFGAFNPNTFHLGIRETGQSRCNDALRPGRQVVQEFGRDTTFCSRCNNTDLHPLR